MSEPAKSLLPFKPEKPKAFTVRSDKSHGGTVTIKVYPAWKDGAWRWRFSHANKEIMRSTRAKSKAAALKAANETARGAKAIEELEPERLRIVKAIAELPDLSWSDYEAIKARHHRDPCTVAAATEEFLELKEANAGSSPHNVRNLRRHLAVFCRRFGKREMDAVSTRDIDRWVSSLKTEKGETASPRTKLNLLRSVKSLFRWADGRIIPKHSNPAEDAQSPNVPAKTPETWTPAELQAMLEAVSPKYAAWLIVSAFAGIRTEEIIPTPGKGSNKTRLQWEDFKWERDLIEIPATTSKTGRRRLIPIQPALVAWLDHYGARGTSGNVHDGQPPHKPLYKRQGGKNVPYKPSETQRLGSLVGGWKRNALRHSFASYRCAIVGPGQSALECGHSEAEARKSYLDAKSEDEAKQYFGVMPGEGAE